VQKDAGKGWKILQTKLKDNGAMSDEVEAKLYVMAEACAGGDFKTALKLNQELSASDWSSHKNWLKGLKSVLQLSQSHLSIVEPEKPPPPLSSSDAESSPAGKVVATFKAVTVPAAPAIQDSPARACDRPSKGEDGDEVEEVEVTASTTAAQLAAEATAAANRDLLRAFYEERDLSKIPKLDSIMAAYSIAELTAALTAK
jgi:hypothetical protein